MSGFHDKLGVRILRQTRCPDFTTNSMSRNTARGTYIIERWPIFGAAKGNAATSLACSSHNIHLTDF
jgi:hypothetical protein